MALTFFSGATTVKVSNPVRGNLQTNKRPHALGRSAAGKLYTYSKGVPHKTLQMEWDELRDVEKIDLDAFFDLVNGPTTSFTFTDHRGTASTVRFIVDELPWEEVDDYFSADNPFTISAITYPSTRRKCGIWKLSIELEVVS